jgi:hypothetical protein
MNVNADLLRYTTTSSLSIYEKMTYIALCSHVNEHGFCSLNIKQLVNEVGCCRTKIFNSLKKLEEWKLISRMSQYKRIYKINNVSLLLEDSKVQDMDSRVHGIDSKVHNMDFLVQKIDSLDLKDTFLLDLLDLLNNSFRSFINEEKLKQYITVQAMDPDDVRQTLYFDFINILDILNLLNNFKLLDKEKLLPKKQKKHPPRLLAGWLLAKTEQEIEQWQKEAKE